MLEKKDRGRSADASLRPLEYGAARVATRVEGAELLEQAMREGRLNSDGELVSSSEGEEEEDAAALTAARQRSTRAKVAAGAAANAGGSGEEPSEGEGSDQDVEWGSSSNDEDKAAAGSSGGEEEGEEQWGTELELHSDEEQDMGSGSEEEEQPEDEGDEEEGAGSGSDSGNEEEEGEGGSGDERGVSSSGSDEEAEDGEDGDKRRRAKRPRREQQEQQAAAAKPRSHLAPQAGSLAQLKRQLAAKKAATAETDEHQHQQQAEDGSAAAEGAEPLEWGRILSEEDFENIRRLKHRQMVEAAMQVRACRVCAGERRSMRGEGGHVAPWPLLRARRCRCLLLLLPSPAYLFLASYTAQKHGLKSARKREKARERAEEEADEALALQVSDNTGQKGMGSACTRMHAHTMAIDAALALCSHAFPSSCLPRSGWAWHMRHASTQMTCWGGTSTGGTRRSA